MSCCVLCRERRGLKITVRTNLSGLGIKESMRPAEEAGEPIFVPNEIVKNTDGYSVFIRQKISLKEYLAGTPLDVPLLRCLIESLCLLNSVCLKKNIAMDNILFDYDAVYVNGRNECMEFTFLPGLKCGTDENLLKDLFGLILLHTDNRTIDNMSGKERDFFTALACVMGDWDETKTKIPVPEFEALLGKKRKVKKQRSRLCLRRVYFLGDLPDMGKAEINVGRDIDWADLAINHAYISRKHAIMMNAEDGLHLRDLESANGTFVDGERLKPKEEVVVKEGQLVQFAKGKGYTVRSKRKLVFA